MMVVLMLEVTLLVALAMRHLAVMLSLGESKRDTRDVVAMSILDKTANNAVLCSQRAKKPNLALKAKISVEEEEEE